MMELISIIEPMRSEEYYVSTIYNDFGYFSENFHYYIANYSKTLIKNIEKDFIDNLPFNYIKKNKEQFFPLKLLIPIWEFCNGELFESVSDFDFLKSLIFCIQCLN